MTEYIGNPIDWIDDDGYEKHPPTISTYGIGVLLSSIELEPGEAVTILLRSSIVEGYFVAERNGLCWVIAENREDSPGWYLPRTSIIPKRDTEGAIVNVYEAKE